MVDGTRIGFAGLAVVFSIFFMLSYVSPVVAMEHDEVDDTGKRHDEQSEVDDIEEHHEEQEDDMNHSNDKDKHHDREEIIHTAINDNVVQETIQNYQKRTEVAYYDNDEDDWRVEIINAESKELERTVVVIDDNTGAIKRVSTYMSPAISEEDAINIARESPEMGEFLPSHTEAEVWASYNAALDEWAVTAFDVETLEQVIVFIDAQTGEYKPHTPTIGWDNALDIVKLSPVADNFLTQHVIVNVIVLYDDLLNLWSASFIDQAEVSLTVWINATNGMVQRIQTFSWREMVQKFEEIWEV